MTTCPTCGTTTDKPTFEDGRDICLLCRIVERLVATQSEMAATGTLMIRAGGDVEEHGRQMLGAARMINGWLDEISEMQRKGAE